MHDESIQTTDHTEYEYLVLVANKKHLPVLVQSSTAVLLAHNEQKALQNLVSFMNNFDHTRYVII